MKKGRGGRERGKGRWEGGLGSRNSCQVQNIRHAPSLARSISLPSLSLSPSPSLRLSLSPPFISLECPSVRGVRARVCPPLVLRRCLTLPPPQQQKQQQLMSEFMAAGPSEFPGASTGATLRSLLAASMVRGMSREPRGKRLDLNPLLSSFK